MRRREAWATRKRRETMRDEIAAVGGASAWIRAGRTPMPISDIERARHAAANAVADKFGFPRPYPHLDETPKR